MSLTARTRFLRAMMEEIDRAYAKHGTEPWTRHEFYGILIEEVEELFDAIKGDLPTEKLLEEMIQVAAMCLRYAETPDRHTGLIAAHFL